MLGTLISYNSAQVCEACGYLKLLSIHFDLCVDATGVVCHQLGFLGTDLTRTKPWEFRVTGNVSARLSQITRDTGGTLRHSNLELIQRRRRELVCHSIETGI